MNTMNEFAFLYRGGEIPTSPEAAQQILMKWVAWFDGLGEKGHVKDRGVPLFPTGGLVSGANKTVSDGPYAEKDLVGGFSLILATDQSEAEELAKGCPILEVGGKVEVRPVRKFSM